MKVFNGMNHIIHIMGKNKMKTTEIYEKALSAVLINFELEGVVTVKDYLYNLLATLWQEQEGFDGKRPFGNSGWEYDIYAALIGAGVISGELDEDGYIDSIDNSVAAHQLVMDLIGYVFYQNDSGENV